MQCPHTLIYNNISNKQELNVNIVCKEFSHFCPLKLPVKQIYWSCKKYVCQTIYVKQIHEQHFQEFYCNS